MTQPQDPSTARLVLVHGSMSSSAQWVDYPALLPGLDVVAVDLPGHGPRSGETFSTAGALEVIGEAAAGDRPVVLVGHSLGGYLCGLFASTPRPRLAGVVLIGATGNPRGPMAVPYRGFAWLTGRVDHRRLGRVRLGLARRLGVREGLLPDAASYGSLPAVWRAVAEDCPPRVLATVACPVLFLNGQFDQMRVDERRYRRLVPGAGLAIVPRASHFAPLTHPAAVASIIRRFVDQVVAVPARQAPDVPPLRR